MENVIQEGEKQALLINQMIPLLGQHYGEAVTRIETHISTLLLVADQAFKIKKPVNFGFLDFSTLALRHQFCEEELRLNRRFSPQLYQRVVPICNTAEAPQIDGDGEVIEYMVQMARFDQQQILDQQISSPDFSLDQLDRLADTLARFHQSIEIADGSASFVQPDVIDQAMAQNFAQIDPMLNRLPALSRQQLSALEQWSYKSSQHLQPLMKERLEQGYIRECHGDLHLGNIALIDGEPTLFDGIEFNESFRWIDVISDLSFLWMDLLAHHQERYACRLLNRYLEESGDYAGVQLLLFYSIYRVMVRVKVGLFRLAQLEQDGEQGKYQEQLDEVVTRIGLGARLIQQRCHFLMITHGVSGSGKSYASQQIVALSRAIRIRSDVERLRRFPDPQQRYSAAASEEVYQTLHYLGALLIASGYSVILDATYLKQIQRQQAAHAAESSGCRWLILDMQCSDEELVRRVEERQLQCSDPSEADVAVLRRQLQLREPLSHEERKVAIVLKPDDDPLSVFSAII